jgi:hypothetical protein
MDPDSEIACDRKPGGRLPQRVAFNHHTSISLSHRGSSVRGSAHLLVASAVRKLLEPRSVREFFAKPPLTGKSSSEKMP